jgi:hypothetical protein
MLDSHLIGGARVPATAGARSHTVRKAERYAQGDIVIERVDDGRMTGTLVERDPDGAVVLARGEATGHRHAFYGGNVVMFRDDALARDLPAGLYVGHIRVRDERAELRHEEHDTITLPKGTYRIRRQREFDSLEATRVLED